LPILNVFTPILIQRLLIMP